MKDRLPSPSMVSNRVLGCIDQAHFLAFYYFRYAIHAVQVVISYVHLATYKSLPLLYGPYT